MLLIPLSGFITSKCHCSGNGAAGGMTNKAISTWKADPSPFESSFPHRMCQWLPGSWKWDPFCRHSGPHVVSAALAAAGWEHHSAKQSWPGQIAEEISSGLMGWFACNANCTHCKMLDTMELTSNMVSRPRCRISTSSLNERWNER